MTPITRIESVQPASSAASGIIMSRDLGAVWLDERRYLFRVWATFSKQVHLHMVSPEERVICMQDNRSGYHQVILDDVAPGTRYVYRLEDGTELPDPVSRYQPDGVFGPSQVVDPRFDWRDAHWFGLPIEHYIIYELHVGTFTPAGTFEAVIPHLDELARLGITAIELMPVAQFPDAKLGL